jgi:signal transduction histidine kinase
LTYAADAAGRMTRVRLSPTVWVVRPRITFIDVVIGLVSAGLLCALMTVALHPEPVSDLGYAMSVVSGLAFTFHRRAPVLCLILTTLAIGVYTASDEAGGPIYLTVFLAAMNLGARVETTREWLPWTIWAAAVLLVAEVIVGDVEWHFFPILALLILLPKLVGDSARARVLRITALEARVESAEHEAQRRMAEERLRIAREVHDVVGHGLAAISLRAGVADHVRDRDPEAVADALQAIRDVSKQSLHELSALLDALRDGEAAERAPAPDLAQVPRLVDTLRDAGLPVELERNMNGAEPPEIVGAAGYRIVQESLTNVVRHAGPGAAARVRLEQVNGALEVSVEDNGRGAGDDVAPGGGITGMRERVQALGGRFEVGDGPSGGFRVWARLPVNAR